MLWLKENERSRRPEKASRVCIKAGYLGWSSSLHQHFLNQLWLKWWLKKAPRIFRKTVPKEDTGLDIAVRLQRELNEIRRFKSRIWNVRLRGSKVSEVKSLQREGGAIWKGILLHVLYECVQVGKWPNVLQWCTLFNPKNREGNDGHLKHSSVASSHNIWRHDIMEARFGKTEQRWCKIQFILHCTKLNSLSNQIRAGC